MTPLILHIDHTQSGRKLGFELVLFCHQSLQWIHVCNLQGNKE